jgi:hypothetical protein
MREFPSPYMRQFGKLATVLDEEYSCTDFASLETLRRFSRILGQFALESGFRW